MNIEHLKNLDQLLETEVKEGRLYGIAAKVGTLEGQTYISEHGDIRRDTPCMLCSMTKPVTSIAAWILIERGIIDPKEPVAKYLPGFANPVVMTENGTVPANREILIRDILNMTSGIPATVSHTEHGKPSAKIMQEVMKEMKKRMDYGEKISNLEILNGFGKAPLLFQPGEHWNYGKNADVLGGVIEAASGLTLGEFFKKEIFEPLNMKDTGFTVSKEKAARAARIGVEQPDKTLKEITSQDFYGDARELWEEPYMESGGGGAAPIMCRGLYSTLDDYGEFCRMLLQKGCIDGKRILSSQTVGTFSENQLTEKQAETLFPGLDGYGYANLMRVMVSRSSAHSNGNNGEFGWDGALGTYMCVDPVAGLYIVLMQQKVADPIVRRKVRNIIYSAL